MKRTVNKIDTPFPEEVWAIQSPLNGGATAHQGFPEGVNQPNNSGAGVVGIKLYETDPSLKMGPAALDSVFTDENAQSIGGINLNPSNGGGGGTAAIDSPFIGRDFLNKTA